MGRLVALIVVLLLSSAAALSVFMTPPTNDQTIYDVSWPNCGVRPPPNSIWAIVGVNGGLDFRMNPCLDKEASWFGHVALYANTGYPGIVYGKRRDNGPRHCRASDKLCWAYNYGYTATAYSIRYADSQGIHSPLWWLDVEADNSWTTNTFANRASLEGAIDAIHQNVFLAIVGLYSYPTQWTAIVGDWRINLPTWEATGGYSLAPALDACRNTGFGASMPWITQYTTALDVDHACNLNFYSSLDHGL